LPFAPLFRVWGLGVDDLLSVPFDELRVLFEHIVDAYEVDAGMVATARDAFPF